MKRTLIITTSFPPQGGGGVVRSSRLAKYLPDYGWGPVILTTRPPRSESSEGNFPLKAIPPVYRAPRMDLPELYKSLKKLFGNLQISRQKAGIKHPKPHLNNEGYQHRRRKAEYFFIPDPSVLWIPGALLFGVVSMIRNRPQVVFSTSPDPSAHLVALLLSTITGKPWVAEFRDPWMTNPFRRPKPFRWQEALEAKLERLVLFRADRIVVTSAQFKDDFLERYPSLRQENIHFVPNGFDPEDFEEVQPKAFDKVTIVHAGNFYNDRSSANFLTALSLLLNWDGNLRSQIQVIFVGGLDPKGQSLISEYGLEDVVIQKGVVSHSESISYVCSADVLLLVPGPGRGTMTGKIFEYLAAKKPIFALADEGPARDLVLETGTGVVSPAEDTAAIARQLEGLLRTVMTEDGYPFQDVSQVMLRYDRRHIAGEIAEILDFVSGFDKIGQG